MLVNTFIHIPTVGLKTEQRIWHSGFHTWDDFINSTTPPLASEKNSMVRQYLKKSIMHIENPSFFKDIIPPKYTWRAFPEFRHRTLYLDIETTGLSKEDSKITTIATYDGRNIQTYINGRNLDQFKKDILNYDVIVTYNGRSFDVPFIEQFFDIDVNHLHIDLRYLLHDLGFRGGLKGCEKALDLDRGDLDGVDGLFAILLWNEYKRHKNLKALETLLAYNIYDVINLEILLIHAYNLKLEQTPFTTSHLISPPETPSVPFNPDHHTILKLKNQFYSQNDHNNSQI